MHKKGQVSIEFVILFGVTIVIFLIVAALVYEERTRTTEELESTSFAKYGNQVQAEILSASTMADGFSRTIALPTMINDKEYRIKIISSNLYLMQGNQEVILPLPQINGTITNLTFTITKNATGMRIQ